jgi:hypothetical protein
VDPPRVDDAARPKTAVRAGPPSGEHTGNAAPPSTGSPGPAVRGDALGGTLARAVAQRARDTSGTPHDAGAMLQRSVATKASDLDKHISASQTVKGAFGKANEVTRALAAIRDALSAYQSAAKKGKSDLATQARQLEALDVLCERFLTQYGTDKRRAIVDRLSNEVNKERAAVSQLRGQQIYQGNVASSKQPVGATETDPAKRFGFKALSGQGKMGAMDQNLAIDPGNTGPGRGERIKLAKRAHGLTDAEISAITIFSAGDFSYINPVTANPVARGWENEVVNPWLVNQRKDHPDEAWARLDDQTLKEEGSLHTAVALQGLLKMDKYPGATYRGARFTPKAFEDMDLRPGKTLPFGTLTSSTKDKNIGINFVYGVGSGAMIDPSKTVAVFYILTDHGGRDISDIALVRAEAEVLLLPGSVFEVKSVQELDAGAENALHAGHVAQAVKKNQPLPTSWFVVRLSLSDKPAPRTPSRPRTPWEGARSAAAVDPFAVPQKVGILGQGHRSP